MVRKKPVKAEELEPWQRALRLEARRAIRAEQFASRAWSRTGLHVFRQVVHHGPVSVHSSLGDPYVKLDLDDIEVYASSACRSHIYVSSVHCSRIHNLTGHALDCHGADIVKALRAYRKAAGREAAVALAAQRGARWAAEELARRWHPDGPELLRLIAGYYGEFRRWTRLCHGAFALNPGLRPRTGRLVVISVSPLEPPSLHVLPDAREYPRWRWAAHVMNMAASRSVLFQADVFRRELEASLNGLREAALSVADEKELDSAAVLAEVMEL